ncbi:translation initiation factor IF-2-like [Mesocricetus auratus]|uniref:Translation initiation factor IF-2-like n=1 Tax=Mesocricetus auratus TaxID=10036 RepID=A0ABM2YGL6_MESAU|nr:translation initiation factor IF-2-like [Mesocricetus auratus]
MPFDCHARPHAHRPGAEREGSAHARPGVSQLTPHRAPRPDPAKSPLPPALRSRSPGRPSPTTPRPRPGSRSTRRKPVQLSSPPLSCASRFRVTAQRRRVPQGTSPGLSPGKRRPQTRTRPPPACPPTAPRRRSSPDGAQRPQRAQRGPAPSARSRASDPPRRPRPFRSHLLLAISDGSEPVQRPRGRPDPCAPHRTQLAARTRAPGAPSSHSEVTEVPYVHPRLTLLAVGIGRGHELLPALPVTPPAQLMLLLGPGGLC